MYETGKHRTALKIRSRLMKVCKRGIALGWMSSNPAEATEQMKVKVRRSRLTMETFLRILDKAPQVNSWIGNAMLLALVSGQDRSTVARWPRSSIEGDVAIVHRTKTEVRIAIPLDLRMDAIGMTLRDVIAKCRSAHVVSQYIVHHTPSSGPMRRGDPVSIKSVSVAFTAARRLAGIPDEGAPTFHEIRSLAKRTYVEQGNVDTKALLGHMSDSAANLYADPRGIAPIKVRIG
ncbi:tyrosine-type recombinase/integrase [Ralstonia mannitolilytica]|nr:tyrosine-type recombinase/integrase [Ralstonia mannitolilytica]MBY4716730.1 tyrosine-type recombinase/integrase [Ralstonia mannitolilytica]